MDREYARDVPLLPDEGGSDESARTPTVDSECLARRSTASPIRYEEHGDPAGPPLVALHGGILTFRGTFCDVLPWLTEGRRVIGVELQGHGHTPDTGRAMSIERFADDVAVLIDRVAGGRPVDVCGFSLGALTATSLALRVLDLFPDFRLAVLPATRHSEVMQRTDELRALLGPFLALHLQRD
jgi:pimeloyl-ACP methyl ester carboxylesterase